MIGCYSEEQKAMLYAMSDIHGCADILQSNLAQVDLAGDNRLILLGDYIDYGPKSGQALRCIYDLQKRHGADKVIVLRGNHEEMLLEWLDAYTGPGAGQPDEYGLIPWSDWLRTDRDYQTFRTLIAEDQWNDFCALDASAGDEWNQVAARMVLEKSGDLIAWLRELPYYYETDRQIFVHAGIDEELGDWWRQGTEPYVFTGKYPATTGSFYKDVIAGHVGTSVLAKDPDFHGVWHDGRSHWYIDGTVNASGIIPILTYDEKTEKYGELRTIDL